MDDRWYGPDRNAFRNPLNYALGFASECTRPFLQFCSRLLCPSPPTSPRTWRRGIMLGADHIGDLLWLTPSLSRLREGLPQCEWYLVASYPGSEVLEGNPYIAGILRRQRPWDHRCCDWTLIREISAVQPDVVLCYNSHEYWRDLWHAVLARVPNRTGYVHKGLSGLVTLPIGIQFPQSFPAYFRSLVAQLTGTDGMWPLRPIVYPSAEDHVAAERVWEEVRPPANMPVLAVFVATRQRVGMWPPERFAESLMLLRRMCPVHILLGGSADEEPHLRDLQARFCPEAKIIAGRLNLRALTVLLKHCDLALTPDSGPRHLANAAGIPVVFLRNLNARRIETGPYLDTETDLAPPLECIRLKPSAMARFPPTAEDIARHLARQLGGK